MKSISKNKIKSQKNFKNIKIKKSNKIIRNFKNIIEKNPRKL